jgi:hypothetical protein
MLSALAVKGEVAGERVTSNDLGSEKGCTMVDSTQRVLWQRINAG